MSIQKIVFKTLFKEKTFDLKFVDKIKPYVEKLRNGDTEYKLKIEKLKESQV